METESEPYVRLATLRQLHRVVAELNTARSLADTLQTVVDGIVVGLGYELACVNLVRPDGDLVVAAFAGDPAAEALITGRVGSRASWERRLTMGENWDGLRFIPHTEGWVLMEDDVPQWHTDGPDPRFEDEWHPEDRLYAPMYASGGELLGVISVDRPRNGPCGREPGAAKRSRCTPSRRRLPSAMPGSGRTCSAPSSGWSASSRRCGPVKSRSARPSSTRPAAWPSPRWAATSTAKLLRTNDALSPAARPPRLRPAPLLLLRPGPPRGHRHPAAHVRRGRPRRAAPGPPRRHVCMGLAAQFRRRRRRRRAPVPAHARRGHRGAQAARAPARPPRQPRLADRPAQQRRAAGPARRAAVPQATVRTGLRDRGAGRGLRGA